MAPTTLQIEARLTPQCSTGSSLLLERIRYFLAGTVRSVSNFEEIPLHECTDQILRTCVERLWIAECSGLRTQSLEEEDEEGEVIYAVEDMDISVHFYHIQSQGAVEEFSEDAGQAEAVMMAHHWTLPCQELEGVWEKVVLLHGPPGTGKTSLCRALAQKLSIRLSNRFRYGKLLEINSHSLFSKWFSESGKMVQKMFDQIWSMVEDEDAFVCVLIDEVESLAAARKAALSGNEPSDSLRVVNALLTQIDRLKQRKNVLILTTSNITEAIDVAFIDRADIKVHVGLPSQRAIHNMLCSSLQELQRVNIIHCDYTPSKWSMIQRRQLEELGNVYSGQYVATTLFEIAGEAEGMSGRAIRKLPFLAHAAHVQSGTATIGSFLMALKQTVHTEQSSLTQV
ncbi:Pachytene checkpoint protein 2 [Mortierella alpina]|nr:Pachytene checkpoint protein 2 [Mortierella alpina]